MDTLKIPQQEKIQHQHCNAPEISMNGGEYQSSVLDGAQFGLSPCYEDLCSDHFGSASPKSS